VLSRHAAAWVVVWALRKAATVWQSVVAQVRDLDVELQ
jgi:hypothetical protein